MRSGGLLTSSSWWQPQHASTDGEAAHEKKWQVRWHTHRHPAAPAPTPSICPYAIIRTVTFFLQPSSIRPCRSSERVLGVRILVPHPRAGSKPLREPVPPRFSLLPFGFSSDADSATVSSDITLDTHDTDSVRHTIEIDTVSAQW